MPETAAFDASNASVCRSCPRSRGLALVAITTALLAVVYVDTGRVVSPTRRLEPSRSDRHRGSLGVPMTFVGKSYAG